MTCKRIDLGSGFQAWSCHRPPGQPACSDCGGTGGVLTCQFDLAGAKAGQRCGKALCAKCADKGKPVLCPPHRRLLDARAAAAAGGRSP